MAIKISPGNLTNDGNVQEGIFSLAPSRRRFLQSLCHSALVLPLDKLLGIELPPFALASPQQEPEQAQAPAPQGTGKDLGDYDNDGYDDLFVTYFGKNALYHNNGDGTYTDVSEKAGVAGNGKRWNTGCTFLDYDRDGCLDLFVANYIDMDLRTVPVPESGPCLYKGVMVACGPPGLRGGKDILYHNNGDGTFTDVSEKAGIFSAGGTYGLGVLALLSAINEIFQQPLGNMNVMSALAGNLK